MSGKLPAKDDGVLSSSVTVTEQHWTSRKYYSSCLCAKIQYNNVTDNVAVPVRYSMIRSRHWQPVHGTDLIA